MKFIISSNPDNLEDYLGKFASTATVEAEYGERVVKGSKYTLAHHGPRSGERCPCIYDNFNDEGIEVAGLSHFDLDSLGGCAAILGEKPFMNGFWDLAAFVDLNGFHRILESGATKEDIDRLYAFSAWSKNNRINAPRDGSVDDITDYIMNAVEVLYRIRDNEESIINEGRSMRSKEYELNLNSFVEITPSGLIVRVSPEFCNFLYCSPDGTPGRAIVSYNPKSGTITLSVAAAESFSCCEIMQRLFGSLAGGHAGIAGSPRGNRMSLNDFNLTYNYVCGVM